MRPNLTILAVVVFVLLTLSSGSLAAPPAEDARTPSQPAMESRLVALETELAVLRAEVAMLATADVRVPDPDVDLDAFLRIPGIPGDSVRSGHEDEIEVSGWTWGARNPTGNGSLAREIVLLKDVDSASAPLFLACVSGTIVPEATLALRRTIEGEASDYLVLKLMDVRITSIEHGIHGEGELVTLSAARIQMTYDDRIVASWDFRTDTPP